ncbi:YgdI/YgdR family lipoprotein [Pseudomonas abieticivorans]|uniref:YgdI/YgdR family lipoprotein n=1 Tax=Pseudomonas abieticivorans TaxID=2931382 RepID=UPI003F693D82
MNMKIAVAGFVLIAGVGLAGCSTQTVVTLQNGTQYVTKDAPKTKSEDGFYEFVDISGKHVKVRADEVATVKEED